MFTIVDPAGVQHHVRAAGPHEALRATLRSLGRPEAPRWPPCSATPPEPRWNVKLGDGRLDQPRWLFAL